MYKQFYEGMSLQELPLFTLVLFVSLFLFVVGRTFLARRSRDFESVASLPLGDDHE